MNGTVELGLVVLSSLMSAAGASPRTIVEGETISSLIDSFAWTLRADNNASSRLHDDPIGEYMTIMDYTDGYVISGMSLYTAPFTDVSHLALVHSSTLFVPGCVAVEIDSDKYHSDCHLGVGLVTIRWEDVGERTHGEFPPDYALLDYWPKSSTFRTQISSQFSNQFSPEFLLNFGLEKAIQLGSDVTGEISQSATGSGGFSCSLSQERSFNTETSEPVISAQPLPDNLNVPYWKFEFMNPEIPGGVSYQFDCYALYEVKDNAVNMSDFVAKIVVDVENTIKWWDNGFLWIGQGWKLGDTEEASMTFYHDVPYDAD